MKGHYVLKILLFVMMAELVCLADFGIPEPDQGSSLKFVRPVFRIEGVQACKPKPVEVFTI